MVCSNCTSTDLRKVSLTHAAGVYESRGLFLGFLLGGMDGSFFGWYRGTSQSRLSRMLNPPRKLPYVAPTILWLIGFFILMSFDGRGKLSWVMGMLSVAYLFVLPANLLASLFYNFFVRPTKHQRWKEKLMCQRCGAMIENELSRGADAQVRA
jgi:hypothetical protein